MTREAKLRRIAGWMGLFTAILGFVVLTGWRSATDPLAFLHLNAAAMKPDAAVCLILTGCSLFLQLRQNPSARKIGLGCAIAALVIVAAGLLQRWFGLDLGFHRLLAGLFDPQFAGRMRMSQHGAFLVGAVTVALLSLGQRRGRTRWPISAWLANLVIGICAAALIAVEFSTSTELTRPLRFSSHLSIALLILSLGILLARPDDRHLRILFANTTAGMLARRLLLGVAIVPVAFNVILAVLVRHDYLALADGIVLFVVAMIVCGFAIALFSIEAAANIGDSREESEQARLQLTARLQEQAAQLQETVSQRTRELREANENLRAAGESNALLALVAQNTTNGVIIADADGRVEWVNAAFTRLTGYDLAEVKGRKPGQFLQGRDTDPAAVAQLRAAERAGQPCKVEILNYTKDGKPFWQILDMQPARDRNGKVVHFIGNQTDITAQREATHQMEALNERLRLALRSSHFGVWEYDIVQGRRHWDDRVLEMFGITREEFDPMRAMWLERVHAEDRTAAAEAMRRTIAGEIPEYTTRFRIVRPDGSVRHTESHGYLQRDARGQPLRMVGLSRDITDQNRMAQALDLAEQRWQLAIEGTNDAAWDFDLTTGRFFHDDRWTRMLGYEPGQLAPTTESFNALLHPDDLPAHEAALREHFEQRSPFYQHELRFRAKDGTWRWILNRGKVVRRATDGRPLRMAGTRTDITERKALEQRLHKSEELAAEVSRLAQIGGWELDLTTRRVIWTEGTRRIHEVDDSFQPSMESMWQFFPADTVGTVQAAFNDASSTAPSFDLEVPLLTARGRRIWVRILGHGEFRNGRAISVHGAIQDVTAQRESEESRRQLEGQLFQAQKMETLGTLAGGIAHDFNNLLTGIIGYHELAADTLPEDHPSRMCLTEARNASMRARELVNQILTFGRQSVGTEHDAIDLSLVIEEARRFLRATLPANVSIEVDCAPYCGTVLADATQIHQVILNLGSNAAHAMRHQGGVLRISLEPTEVSPDLALTLGNATASSYVRLTVADTGHGMDESTRRRIFDPFFTTKNTREGTGLGLAVVHGIVRSHHGAIDVESSPGHGSKFHIYLPTAKTETETPDLALESAPRGGGEFVYVVDDEEVVGSCTKLVLENKGYRSLVFTSAEQCLEEAAAHPNRCTILVTDQTMPGMQGTELAAAMRRLSPGLPVVIMSGYFSKISPQALDDLGQVELLGKPFTTDELLLAVHRALYPIAKVS